MLLFLCFLQLDNNAICFYFNFDRSSVRNHEKMYKPSFAGYVETNLTDKRLSLRSLVSYFFSFRIKSTQTHFSFFVALIIIWFFFQIDHSVVESFGDGGKTCITSRVYPALAIYGDTHLFAFNNGTEPVKIETLDAWNMAKSEKWI